MTRKLASWGIAAAAAAAISTSGIIGAGSLVTAAVWTATLMVALLALTPFLALAVGRVVLPEVGLVPFRIVLSVFAAEAALIAAGGQVTMVLLESGVGLMAAKALVPFTFLATGAFLGMLWSNQATASRRPAGAA